MKKNRRTDSSSPYEPREHYPEPPDRDGNRFRKRQLAEANEPELICRATGLASKAAQ